MKKILFLFFYFSIFFLNPLQAHQPDQIKFCISLDHMRQKNNGNFDHTIQLLQSLISRQNIGVEEAATLLQLLVFLAINSSPYKATVTLEVDGVVKELPFSYELFWQLLELNQEHNPEEIVTMYGKRPHVSSSFLSGYSDIE